MLLLCNTLGVLLLKYKKIVMFCQGESLKCSVCAAANAEPGSVVLTQAEFLIDLRG